VASGSEGKRVAVLGAGANGAGVGAELAAAGVDVTLIEQWPAHVEKMRADGLRIEMPDRVLEQPVTALHLCEVAEIKQPFDVVLMLMKAYDSRWAAELIKPVLAADGLLAGVQNGFTAGTIADVVGPERAIGCVIECSAQMDHPGVVKRDTPPEKSWFAVGSLSEATAGRESEVADLLAHAGRTEVVDDIRSAKWMKLVSNATTLVTTAILGEPMMASLKHEAMRDLMIASGQEALRAGLAQGYEVQPIFGLTAEDLTDSGAVVEKLLDVLYEGFVLPSTTTTVLHDWSKGRRSEVDDINGAVVAQLGTDAAPVNAAVIEMAHRIERGDLDPKLSNYAELASLAGLA
jgi:2-dehydropantoate 2-reductase